jgi:hypothetical protein
LGLFCGVESFNPDLIKAYSKRQNLLLPQTEMIRGCLEAGIAFLYGMIFDPTVQSLEQMRDELDFVVRCYAIPLPGFLSLTIPLLGTLLIHDRVRSLQFLPNAKLRDMDGFTLLTRPHDDIGQVVPFVRSLVKLDGYGGQVVRHSLNFWWRYRPFLSTRQMACLIGNSARLCLPAFISNRKTLAAPDDEKLTYVTTTQPLGPLYRPFFPVAELYRDCFTPTMITDDLGELDSGIARDLSAIAALRPKAATPAGDVTAT